MPKKRKRGAGLGNRKKSNIKGTSYVRQTVDGVQIYKNNNYKSLNIDSNPPINLSTGQLRRGGKMIKKRISAKMDSPRYKNSIKDGLCLHLRMWLLRYINSSIIFQILVQSKK